MSYHTLQHLVVRMLFDPAFVNCVYQNPEQALADLNLSEQEKKQLLATDPRAWNYDPLRRLRTMRTLVEEFKVSTTLVLSEIRKLSFLENFFSSQIFHQFIQDRKSMALAFAEYLSNASANGELTTPHLNDVLRLETLMARCRRELTNKIRIPALPEKLNENLRVRLIPGADVGAFQANTVETIQAVEKYLFEVSLMPAMVLCDDAPRLENLPTVEQKKKIYLLCLPGANGVSLVDINRLDYLVLIEARTTLTIRQIVERALASGVPRAKAQEIIATFLEEGTLYLN
jgi:hypothetical protein